MSTCLSCRKPGPAPSRAYRVEDLSPRQHRKGREPGSSNAIGKVPAQSRLGCVVYGERPAPCPRGECVLPPVARLATRSSPDRAEADVPAGTVRTVQKGGLTVTASFRLARQQAQARPLTSNTRKGLQAGVPAARCLRGGVEAGVRFAAHKSEARMILASIDQRP